MSITSPNCNFHGSEGGPFNPGQVNFKVTNTGRAKLNVHVATLLPGIFLVDDDLHPLAPGASVYVTVSVNPHLPGRRWPYQAVIKFIGTAGLVPVDLELRPCTVKVREDCPPLSP